MKTIKAILMKRDKMTAEEADDLIVSAKEELNELLADGNFSMADDICADFFGLEPDYLEELISY